MAVRARDIIMVNNCHGSGVKLHNVLLRGSSHVAAFFE